MRILTVILGFSVLVVGLLIPSAALAQATISWTNTAGGNWSDAVNWSPNQVPGAADTALITTSGNYTIALDTSPTVNTLNWSSGGLSGSITVTGTANWTGGELSGTLFLANGADGETMNVSSGTVIGADVTINNLTLSGGTLEGTNTVTGSATWTGGQINPGVLTIANAAVLTISGNNNYLLDVDGALNNAGTINWTSGNLELVYNISALGDNGSIINLPSGVFNAQCSGTIYNNQGPEFFNNQGLVTSAANPNIGVIFNNSGTLDVESGTVNLNNQFNLTGGTLNFGISGLTSCGQLSLGENPSPLTGTLAAHLNDGYIPSVNNMFLLISYPGFSGAFTNVTLPGRAAWQTAYNPGNVTITVTELFSMPSVTAGLAVFSRPRNLGLVIPISDLLTNAIDADGDALSLAAVSAESTNGAAISTNRLFVFYSPPAAHGNVTDRFSYTVADPYGNTSANMVEVILQPDSNNPSPNVTRMTVNNDGTVTLGFAGIPGFSYLIQTATSLASSWTTLATVKAGADGLFSYTDHNPTQPAGYYRTATP
jgi:hypothetical protein